ncbi:MAG: alpha/beta hydrolase family esterase [Mycobacteriaceae bacterium]|uniref:alpha/beta hydrolase family esterase n=1 Tax=Corynebacterium sp. TaxID=1720 RepID=UPI003F96E8F2
MRPAPRVKTSTVAAVALTATLALTACSVDGSDSRSGTDDPVSETASPGSYTAHSTTVDDHERTWNTYTPAAASDPKPESDAMPIVLVIHGTGDTGAGIRSGIGEDLERIADSAGFVIAYVDGYENNWNECRAEGDWPAKEQDLDDVQLMRDVVDSTEEDLGADTVDTGQVFALGFSSGGHMAQRVAYEAPDLVSGIASINANIPTADNRDCDDAGEPVPTIFMQGREDPMNPFDGGEVVVGTGRSAESRGDVLSAEDSAGWFAERNGLSPEPSQRPERDGDGEITDWEGDNPVRLIAIDHSGHSFPTQTGRWGNDNGARYDGPGAVWRFFSETIARS